MTGEPDTSLFFPSSEVSKIRQLIQHNYHRVREGLPATPALPIESQLTSSSLLSTTFLVDAAGRLLLPAINTPTFEAEIDNINRLMLVNESKSEAGEAKRRLRHNLLVEYCLLQDWIVQGVTVMPSLDPDSMDWEGIVSPEAGIYRGLHIPFFVHFPKDYPVEAPDVVFDPILSHPLIDPQTGQLSLKPGFSKWKAEAHNLVQVLAFIRSTLFDAKLLKPQHPTNEDAAARVASLGLVGAGIIFRDEYKAKKAVRVCRMTQCLSLEKDHKLDTDKLAEMAQSAAQAIGSHRLKEQKPSSVDSHVDLRLSADLLDASNNLWDAFSISLEESQMAALETKPPI